MTITSGIFNSVNGDRKYNAQWFAEYFASFIGNGVFPNPSTNLQVVEGANMQTIVRPGKGWINGYYVNNDSNYVLQHDVADGVLKRIDRVVMRLNYLTRQIEIAIKKGTFASSPVAPTLQRDTDAYELALADVLIGNGATIIAQANITDQRLNTVLCGIVHGTVDQVDTKTLFNQYQSWFGEWTDERQIEFDTWLETLQDVLDGDVAANLANRILNIEEEVGAEVLLTTSKTLKGAINEVFQSGNNVKVNMVDALLQVDPSLPINYESTWNEIEAATAKISTGKKDASGTVTEGSDFYVTVRGLSFQPRIIILESGNFRRVIRVGYSSTLNNVRYTGTNATNIGDYVIYNDGFSIRMAVGAGTSYTYTAVE